MGQVWEALDASPPIFNRAKADADFSDLLETLQGDGTLCDLRMLVAEQPAVCSLFKSIFGASPFLTGLILREPEGVQEILLSEKDGALDGFCGQLEVSLSKAVSLADAQMGLRLFKRRVALLVAILDIGEIASVEATIRALSICAGVALNGAIRFLLNDAARRGDYFPVAPDAAEKQSGYIVLGLGKLGAFELNYSSDVDIVVFYETGKCKLRDGLSEQQFFVKITRDLVKLMQERTADGYVFRTDLRLRPDPGATQVSLSTEAALIYYESFGQNWERAAMIKARPVAGDVAAGEAFLSELAPFVWRKYLDFAAIADVHAMKRQIHAVKGHGDIAVKGHNLKLGRGGIREIEFFTQTQQLIAGGRQEELRVRGTLDALQELVRAGWIEEKTAEELTEAYCFLRRVEHRLQMIADEQTHSLPTSDEDLTRIALFSGFETYDQFAACLTGYLECVQGHYGALFEDVPELSSKTGNLVFTGDSDDPGTVETIHSMGFQDPSQVIQTVKNWHFGRYPATRSARARERLTELQPVLLSALADTAQPDAALTAFDRFLSDLPTGIQLFSLLRNNPRLLELLAELMGTAPRLAGVLSRRATLLDAVLDPGFFGTLPSEAELQELVDDAIGGCDHFQDCLDLARDIGQEQSFLFGVRILSGTVTASQAGGAFAQLATHLIHALKQKVEREMIDAHGRVPGGEAAILAMGKLGGEEMTANSDLDLIMVYDYDEASHQSDGEKPLSVSQYYARYTQRLISALTAPTARGKLYEVDMRLRPSGNAGPVASSFSSFVDYQLNQAWTWEHMALTRARVVSASPALKERLEELISRVLCQKRDATKIAADMLEMRGKIREAKGAGSLWEIKQVRGGLVDLEFVSQYYQLLFAHEAPGILSSNTLRAFRQLKEAGILSHARSDVLIPAAQLYNNLTQILRLCFEGPFDSAEAPQGLKALLAQVSGEPDFERLEVRLGQCEEEVGALFDEIFGDISVI